MRTVEAVGRELRRARGREKQIAVARKAGISDATLSRLERGERPEGLELLLKVVSALGLEMRFARRSGALLEQDPVTVVEEALRADPELKDHTREVVLAAYRRGRTDDDNEAQRPKASGGWPSR